ncbi:hypothetical protein IW150_001758 [Coemansia sp. RSA 2607]|nr:hypothetical protein IW150_001758 [Coemansia sp. RSA 2607]KAJ2386911.1 hypothetical protein GGI05_004237 [Coemansia sp. RSA 2603]
MIKSADVEDSDNASGVSADATDTGIPTKLPVLESASATGALPNNESLMLESEESNNAQPTASHGVSAARETGSYVPLFDFDLAPYNMALEIVAEALEKLADTMEPIDLPLPIVGPGYYLEVMVKAPNNKNPHNRPPYNQINPISIEGGQAPPITEIDIILPGESEAHQTIILPAPGQTRPSASAEGSELPTFSESSAVDVSLPIANTDTIEETLSLSDTVSAIDTMTMFDPIPAGTESGSAPLIVSVPSASSVGSASVPSVLVGQFSNSGFFEGHLSGVLSFGAPSETSVTSGSESPAATETVVSIIGGSDLGNPFTDSVAVSIQTPSNDSAFEMSEIMTEPSTTVPVLESDPLSESGSESDDMLNTDLEAISGDIPEIIGGAYASSVAIESSSLLSSDLSEEGPLEGEVSSDSLELDGMPSDSFLDVPVSSAPELSLSPSSSSDSAIPEDVSPVLDENDSSVPSPLLATDSFEESEVATVEVPTGTADMTMASVPLPYPPFGGPQQQQQPTVSDVNGLPTAELPSAEASAPAISEDNVIETINVVGASDGNALEASIDAILHSVLQEYESESTPKAAVGFALIHARNQAMTGILE